MIKDKCSFVIEQSSDWFDCLNRIARHPSDIGMSCISGGPLGCPTKADQKECKYAKKEIEEGIMSEKYGDHVVTGGSKMGNVEEFSSMTLRELYVKEVLSNCSVDNSWPDLIAKRAVRFVDAVLKEMSND